MKQTLAVLSLLLASPVFAVGSGVTNGNTGTGAQIVGVSVQTLGDKTATLVVSNGSAPSLNVVKDGGAGPGANASTSSFGLSVGAVLGGGFGGTGGTSGTQLSLPASP